MSSRSLRSPCHTPKADGYSLRHDKRPHLLGGGAPKIKVSTVLLKMLAALCMLNSAGAKTLDRANQGHPSDHSDAMMLASTSSALVPPSDDKACEPSNLNSSAL